TIMVRHSNYTIWFTTLLLLLVADGCSDPDKAVAPGLTPPTMISVAPTGATGACTNTILSAVFSEAMNPDTINASTFTLAGPNSASVSGQVTYNATTHPAVFTSSTSTANIHR